ncbi:MAG: putative 2OG-Fe(II) oxygenase [Alphaproteobacteria bacterium]|nr:putative 2OG-Fe(II) oxygenase [Alphaproteobacteria bacterium]
MRKTVPIGPTQVDVWPKNVILQHIDPLVCVAIFPDNDRILKLLEEPLLQAEAKFRAQDSEQGRWIGGGGAKIRDFGSWQCPTITLLNERVKQAFMKITGAKTAHIDDVWANVSRKGEYIGPHGHRRTEVSAVYHLLPPEPGEREQFNGALGISDPRVQRCCPTKQGLVTSQVYPPLEPGTLVLFPSFVTHYVTPHMGEGHRISIAWNIDRNVIPGRPEDEALLPGQGA